MVVLLRHHEMGILGLTSSSSVPAIAALRDAHL
jgi:hypothetical protein